MCTKQNRAFFCHGGEQIQWHASPVRSLRINVAVMVLMMWNLVLANGWMRRISEARRVAVFLTRLAVSVFVFTCYALVLSVLCGLVFIVNLQTKARTPQPDLYLLYMQVLYSSAFWLEFLIFIRFAKVPQTPVKDRFSRQRSSNHKPSSHPWSVYPHCLPHWIRVSLKEDPFGKQCKQWHDAQDVLAGIVTARVKKNWRGVFQNQPKLNPVQSPHDYVNL